MHVGYKFIVHLIQFSAKTKCVLIAYKSLALFNITTFDATTSPQPPLEFFCESTLV